MATVSRLEKHEPQPLLEINPELWDSKWDYGLIYKDAYEISGVRIITRIRGRQSIFRYPSDCVVNLPDMYRKIVRYSKAVAID